MVSQPSPDCHLIDLDAGLVTTPHKTWFSPMGWFLPKQIISNIHMKIGVKGGLKRGKVRMHGKLLLGAMMLLGANGNQDHSNRTAAYLDKRLAQQALMHGQCDKHWEQLDSSTAQ
jgi:hypothetical protein